MEAFIGAFIRNKRLEHNYSQEWLCKDICVCSYLSKIENGQINAGEDIIRALLKKLGVNYNTEPEFINNAADIVEELYHKLHAGLFNKDKGNDNAFKAIENKQLLLESPFMLDIMLFNEFFKRIMHETPNCRLLKPYSSYMTQRQFWLYTYLKCAARETDVNELLKLAPNGFYLVQAGVLKYFSNSFMEALNILNRAYGVCSAEGTVHNMLLAKLFAGNCYANLYEHELMQESYRAAINLAEALNDDETINAAYYNMFSQMLEENNPETALLQLKMIKRKDTLFYHKYAICLEKMGRTQEALQALADGRNSSDFNNVDCADKMYEVVRYRLTHKSYVKEKKYAELLRDCIKDIEEKLPFGFAQFHYIYLVEVLEAERKYKEIYMLYRERKLNNSNCFLKSAQKQP